jgi:bifunctional ADP-heptose synthase (sugar kinase/adenylyltransferase)
LDTRKKIVTLAQAQRIASDTNARWFSAHFDPLLAAHVRMLNEVASPGQVLIVQITDPAQPLLSSRARAELVAGLAAVDYVAVEPASATAAPDDEVRNRFIEGVRRRANGAAV